MAAVHKSKVAPVQPRKRAPWREDPADAVPGTKAEPMQKKFYKKWGTNIKKCDK